MLLNYVDALNYRYISCCKVRNFVTVSSVVYCVKLQLRATLCKVAIAITHTTKGVALFRFRWNVTAEVEETDQQHGFFVDDGRASRTATTSDVYRRHSSAVFLVTDIVVSAKINRPRKLPIVKKFSAVDPDLIQILSECKNCIALHVSPPSITYSAPAYMFGLFTCT
jgi:hypothetical protein